MTPITITEATLKRSFEVWNVPLPKPKEKILFGIRGALPVEAATRSRSRWLLKKAILNYKHMRCTLGIWDRGTGTIYLAPGSTVPNIEQVQQAAKRGGKGANQMEPGYYLDLEKGEHLQGKLKGHSALRQTANRFIRRSATGLPFSQQSPLYFSNPYDNLHCAWNKNFQQEGYASSGCLVVSGLPYCPRLENSKPNSGPWKIFHSILYDSPQKKFGFVLWEFSQLQTVHSKSRNNFHVPLLMYGSEGESVKILQTQLKKQGTYLGPLHGKLDARTYKAWNAVGFNRLKV